jgi:DNA-binding protein Fis
VISLKDSERRQVERVLKLHEGNRTRAARDLGISRVTLLKKIKEYGLT